MLGAAALAALHGGEARAEGRCPLANVASTTGAQISTCIDADNFWPHTGAGPFLSLGATSTAPAGRISFGLVASYLSRPVAFRLSSPDPAGTTIYALDNVVDATLLWSVGISDRVEISLAAPMTLYQDGPGLDAALGTSATVGRSAIRDLRFGTAVRLLERPRIGEDRGPALTARLEFAAPLGSRDVFASAGSAVALPSLTFDERLGRLGLSAEIGARLRKEQPFADVVVGSQLSAALGASFDVLPGRRLTVSAEAFGLYTLARGETTAAGAASARLVPAEWIAGITTAPALAGDVSLSLGGGGPIPLAGEPGLTSPRFRFELALRYAPLGRDTDADGVLDRDDRCPEQPEDRDGFQDDDGCPDPDNDGDGIPDVKDRCRDAAEDFDGFKDNDGCPDLDDDDDGTPDARDKCRNEPEDRDGFQDDDGCPDPDNDEDGIPDVKDRCPNGAEDKDGFKDDDGCPDPDDDLDQIRDADDRCPNEPEDKDGFQDDDGCPDPDNDEDGVLDAVDRCPTAPETIDGLADEDGCPEPGARSLVSWSGSQVVVASPERFATGSDKLTPALEKQAKLMAQLIQGRAKIATVIVEAYPDRAGDTSPAATDLAGRRASAMKMALVAAGLPADRITAIAGDPSATRDVRAPALDVTVERAATEKKKRR
jgi:OmpA-OmpF porin, OOP family